MKILFLENDEEFKTNLLQEWSVPDTEIMESSGGSSAIQLITQGGLGALFVSTELLNIDRLDIIHLAREKNPGIDIFVLAGPGQSSIAEQAVQKGAHSFFMKPVSVKFLESLAIRSSNNSLTRQNYRYMEEHVLGEMFGNSAPMKKILRTITKVAPTNSTILISGESGTGKEFLASIIHRLSNRANENFVTVNCGALPENLVESELFGAKKGSFTGSVSDKRGLVEDAELGTLFLDEIGELSLPAQVKMLRFLQEKEFRRVGETENRYVNTRVIAATNRDLHVAIREGAFREDLYYRLSTFHFNLPALRERRETIPGLVANFVKRYSSTYRKNVRGISHAAESILLEYDYPGNIRQLQNIIEHAVTLAEGENIKLEDLPDYLIDSKPRQIYALPASTGEEEMDKDSFPTLSDMEKEHIRRALEVFDYNHTEVSRRLGISRSSLWRKIKEYQLEPRTEKAEKAT